MTCELSQYAAHLRELIGQGDLSPGTFNPLALELFALQFQHNLPYRKFCEARRVTPLTATHWSQIPALPAAALKEGQLTCLAPAERTRVFHSSGTTEQRPSRHFHCAESLAVYEASLLQWFGRHRGVARSLLMLTPPANQVPHSSLAHMFNAIRLHDGLPESVFVGQLDRGGDWQVNFTAAIRGLEWAEETGEPLFILGTAFSFVHLLDELVKQERRFRLPFDSAALETGGYKGRSRTLSKAELHALISDRLGISSSHIVCEYGMSELSSQAYDRGLGDEWRGACNVESPRHPAPGTRHFLFPPWARAQITSPETGREVADAETGLLRIFDLANVGSVLAIQTEDLAIRRGDGFELLGRAQLAEPRGCSLLAV